MVNSDRLERQLAEGLEQLAIPSDWRSQIQRLIQGPEIEDRSAERARLERTIDRLRYQHLCEAIDDETFRREYRALRHQLERIPNVQRSIETYQEPVRLFQSIGKVLGHPAIRLREDAMLLYRQFCELAFSRIDVEGPRIVALYPQAQYRELFAISLVSRGWHGAVERT